ncbi:MAG: PhzF family phenazine biosynthesis protein [Deltaproteobacteria bacterium]|nr:PhzF family phenazine biosynthesis protein [Deltaproteobacteria bacterium]MBW2085290.1 PhzF family phenazine biosynthesis protein [Deltaproteobacteria bacterium]
MRIPLYQVDAFTSQVFTGNPAAVCPLETWLDDSLLQAIAQENNLSETAFLVLEKNGYHIRWFTPVAEVPLCGHATLASAFVIFNYYHKEDNKVTFSSQSGNLTVERKNDLLAMDFPSQPPTVCEAPEELLDGLGKDPLEVLSSENYLVVFSSEEDIIQLRPDMEKLKKLDLQGVIVTAQGKDVDFVSRFFAPKLGIDEDPVTGSAHCALTPYWAQKLNKKTLHARQVSRRGGELFCADLGDRVEIAGRAVMFMEGIITV